MLLRVLLPGLPHGFDRGQNEHGQLLHDGRYRELSRPILAPLLEVRARLSNPSASNRSDTWNPAPCRVAWRAKSAARSTRESKWAARPAARPPPLRRRKPSRDDSNHHPLAPRPTPSAARRLCVRQRRHSTHDNYNKFNMNDTHLRRRGETIDARARANIILKSLLEEEFGALHGV